MADSTDIALAFVAAHPGEAARVLESLPTRDAGELFAAIPAPLAARVFAAMLPTAAARILGDLPESVAVALAAAADTQSIVAILRHVEPALRTRLLAALPATAAVAARMLLGFPDDSVGAWTDTAIVVVPAASNAAAALDLLRAAAGDDHDRVYVVDADQRLVGSISLHGLLRADARALASSLARPAPAVLAAMMPLASVRGSTVWERTQSLPVLDRDQRLVGILRRAALSRAMRARSRTGTEDERIESVAATLARSYWGIVAGLSSATLSLLPPVKRVLPEDA